VRRKNAKWATSAVQDKEEEETEEDTEIPKVLSLNNA
jgi:hypothetical protein